LKATTKATIDYRSDICTFEDFKQRFFRIKILYKIPSLHFQYALYTF